jgi:hypothetical protein
MSIAKTILEQIGGNKFCAMIGVKQLGDTGNGLSVKWKAKSKDGSNYLNIELNGLDLYDLKFKRIWGTDITDKKELNNIYAEDLMDIFEDTTGLFLTFNSRK